MHALGLLLFFSHYDFYFIFCFYVSFRPFIVSIYVLSFFFFFIEEERRILTENDLHIIGACGI